MKKILLSIFFCFSVFTYSNENSSTIRSSDENVVAIVSYVLEGLGWNVSNGDSAFSIDITSVGFSTSDGFTGTIELNDLRTNETILHYNFNSASPDEISLNILNLIASIE